MNNSGGSLDAGASSTRRCRRATRARTPSTSECVKIKPKLTFFPCSHQQNLKFWEKGPPSDPQESLVQSGNDADPDQGHKQKDDKGSMHYGDPGYNAALNNPEDYEEDIEDTTWGEVCRTCWCHTPKEWGKICIYMVGICFFLYFFIFSLELLSSGAKVLTGCAAAGLFGDNTNPVAALIIGMLVTVLLQSSSTTTAIIVSLVGSGAITVEPAIYMVMGEYSCCSYRVLHTERTANILIYLLL